MHRPYRLVIIDSIMGLFRVDYSGRGELADRQQKLNRHLSSLSKLAGNLKVAVVIVNQVTADPGANAMFVRDAKKPVGGHILAHASQTRLYFRKGKCKCDFHSNHYSLNVEYSNLILFLTSLSFSFPPQVKVSSVFANSTTLRVNRRATPCLLLVHRVFTIVNRRAG